MCLVVCARYIWNPLKRRRSELWSNEEPPILSSKKALKSLRRAQQRDRRWQDYDQQQTLHRSLVSLHCINKTALSFPIHAT